MNDDLQNEHEPRFAIDVFRIGVVVAGVVAAVLLTFVGASVRVDGASVNCGTFWSSTESLAVTMQKPCDSAKAVRVGHVFSVLGPAIAFGAMALIDARLARAIIIACVGLIIMNTVHFFGESGELLDMLVTLAPLSLAIVLAKQKAQITFRRE